MNRTKNGSSEKQMKKTKEPASGENGMSKDILGNN